MIRSASKERWTDAKNQIAHVKDPLAADIYQWMFYTKATPPFQFEKMAGFIKTIPGWPRQGTLKLAAEKSVTTETSSDQVIEWFSAYPPATSDGMDRYLAALKERGNLDGLALVINRWWGDANLTPDQQGWFLKNYGKLITNDSHKRRFNTTLYKDQYTAARSIARVLGRGYPELAEARIVLARGDSNADYYISRVQPHLMNDSGLALERLRWRRKKNLDFRALEILHNPPPRNQIANPEDWWKERHILARRLMEGKQFESAYLLVAKHGAIDGVAFAEAEFLAGFLALRFVNRPWNAFEHFERVYKNSTMPISRARGAYWAGRASDALGQEKIADQWYEAAAQYPTTFYGQMAMGELGRADDLVMVVPPLEAKTRADFERSSLIQAAHLFRKANLLDEASLFLRAYADNAKKAEQFHLVAQLATEWSAPEDSVAIAKKAQTKGVVLADYAFPTILSRMKNVDGEWALIHALIKQESAFDHRAVSPAGARGLMQLMPATANEVAKKLGVSHQKDWLITRPDHNIRLGNSYIRRMIALYDGNYPMAIASYNAGPGRVKQWVSLFGDPRRGDIDLIDWMELIPVAETRNYVQRVLEGVYIYRHKFREIQKTDTPVHVAYASAKRKAK